MKRRKKKTSRPPTAKAGTPSPAPLAGSASPPPASRQAAAEGVVDPEAAPVVSKDSPMPTLPIVLLGVLLYIGYLYVASTAGGFDLRVYDPYTSVKQLTELQPKSAADEQYALGRKVYTYICVQCHLANGQGNPAMFIPPLDGSEWVLAQGPGRLIRIVSKGLTGPITVAGQQFGAAAMFAAGDQLPGDEEQKVQQIAAVLSYIRSSWSNKAAPVTVEQVRAVREKIANRTDPWTADELLKIPENE